MHTTGTNVAYIWRIQAQLISGWWDKPATGNHFRAPQPGYPLLDRPSFIVLALHAARCVVVNSYPAG